GAGVSMLLSEGGGDARDLPSFPTRRSSDLAEELLRDQHPVARDYDHARLAGEGGQLVRLLDGDLEALRDLLRRRGGLLPTATLRLVGSREEELDVVAPVGHPFEHG